MLNSILSIGIVLGLANLCLIQALAAEDGAAVVRNPYIFPDATWTTDWRAFEDAPPIINVNNKSGGLNLPKKWKYAEGLGSHTLAGDVRMQTITVGIHEGHPSQHIITRRSGDGGKTWTDWIPVEPEGPPMSQYGGLVKHPTTGRCYFVYALGPKSRVPPLPTGKRYRGPYHPHHIAQVAFRHVHADGAMDQKRHIMALPKTAIDTTNIYKGKHTFFYTSPKPSKIINGDGLGRITKLGPRPLVSEGEAFLVLFKDWEKNDRLEELKIELLPKGPRGIRDPTSTCIAEFGSILIEPPHYWFKYRTTAGYAGLAKSSDNGRSFTTGPMRYALDERPVKNPQGPLRTFRDADGRRWLTWYNAGYRDEGAFRKKELKFDARDLVFIAPIRIHDGKLRVGQGELANYRKDQQGFSGHLRMNCLTFSTLEGDAYLGKTSNKFGLRSVRVPKAFADLVAGQFDHRGIPEQGLLVHHAKPGDLIPAPTALPASAGASLVFEIPSGLTAGTVLFDGTTTKAAGMKLTIGKSRDLLLTFGDGTRKANSRSDVGSLDPKKPHHIAVIVDGNAGLVSMVIDGRLQDGGTRDLRGMTRFDPAMGSLRGAKTWRVHKGLSNLRVYNRFLLTTEAIGAWRESTQAVQATP